MNELLARIEAATGPDAAIDMALWWLSLPEDTRASFGSYVNKSVAKSGTDILAQFYDSSKPHCIANLAQREKFTASLDAAVSLVNRMLCPGILDMTVTWDTAQPPADPAALIRWYPDGKSGKSWFAQTAGAPTAPLAICAVLVKALIASDLQKATHEVPK